MNLIKSYSSLKELLCNHHILTLTGSDKYQYFVTDALTSFDIGRNPFNLNRSPYEQVRTTTPELIETVGVITEQDTINGTPYNIGSLLTTSESLFYILQLPELTKYINIEGNFLDLGRIIPTKSILTIKVGLGIDDKTIVDKFTISDSFILAMDITEMSEDTIVSNLLYQKLISATTPPRLIKKDCVKDNVTDRVWYKRTNHEILKTQIHKLGDRITVGGSTYKCIVDITYSNNYDTSNEFIQL